MHGWKSIVIRLPWQIHLRALGIGPLAIKGQGSNILDGLVNVSWGARKSSCFIKCTMESYFCPYFAPDDFNAALSQLLA